MGNPDSVGGDMTEVEKIIKRLGGVGILTEGDIPSLESQQGKVLKLMSDGRWHPAREVLKVAGGTEGLRRLRELRTMPGVTIEKMRRVDDRRFFHYRLRRDG